MYISGSVCKSIHCSVVQRSYSSPLLETPAWLALQCKTTHCVFTYMLMQSTVYTLACTATVIFTVLQFVTEVCIMVVSWHALFFCTDIHLFIPYHILMWSFQPNAAQQSLKHCRNVQLLPAQLNILRPTKLASIAQQLPEQNILSHHQACLDICWHHVDQTGNRMFVSFNIVIYIYWLIRLFWS